MFGNSAAKIAYYKRHGWPEPVPESIWFLWHSPLFMIIGLWVGCWIASLW